MGKITLTANNTWAKIKSTFSQGNFLTYSSYDAYMLIVCTFILITYKEYGPKTARLTMDWFGIDLEALEDYEKILDKDNFLQTGDRTKILHKLIKMPVTGTEQDNYSEYLSSSQWFAAFIFLDKKYMNRHFGKVDQSALFPSNITKLRTTSYMSNETKIPMFERSVKFVDGLAYIGSRAMKLHLISIATSLVWYSDEPSWTKEHIAMWVHGNNGTAWLARRGRLFNAINEPYNGGGIW